MSGRQTTETAKRITKGGKQRKNNGRSIPPHDPEKLQAFRTRSWVKTEAVAIQPEATLLAARPLFVRPPK
jgi:hypothetical protein